MKYRIKVQEFGEHANNCPLGETTEEEAQRQYDATKCSLSVGKGGYVQLFEQGSKTPIKAERVGYERYTYIEEKTTYAE